MSAPRVIKTMTIEGCKLRPFDLVVVNNCEWQVHTAPDRNGMAVLRDPAETMFSHDNKRRIRVQFDAHQLYNVRRSVPAPVPFACSFARHQSLRHSIYMTRLANLSPEQVGMIRTLLILLNYEMLCAAPADEMHLSSLERCIIAQRRTLNPELLPAFDEAILMVFTPA